MDAGKCTRVPNSGLRMILTRMQTMGSWTLAQTFRVGVCTVNVSCGSTTLQTAIELTGKVGFVAAFSTLLHKGSTKTRYANLCFNPFLQTSAFSEWAMLGSNQRPLPGEGSVLPLS
jgi:hypothetical protein